MHKSIYLFLSRGGCYISGWQLEDSEQALQRHVPTCFRHPGERRRLDLRASLASITISLCPAGGPGGTAPAGNGHKIDWGGPGGTAAGRNHSLCPAGEKRGVRGEGHQRGTGTKFTSCYGCLFRSLEIYHNAQARVGIKSRSCQWQVTSSRQVSIERK